MHSSSPNFVQNEVRPGTDFGQRGSPVDDLIRDAVGRATQKSRFAQERTVDAINSLTRKVELVDDRHRREIVGITTECTVSLSAMRAALQVLSHKMNALETTLDANRLEPIQDAYRALQERIDQIASRQVQEGPPAALQMMLAKIDQHVVDLGNRLADAKVTEPQDSGRLETLADRLDSVTQTLESQAKARSDMAASTLDLSNGDVASAFQGLDDRVVALTEALMGGLSRQESRQVETVLQAFAECGLERGTFAKYDEKIGRVGTQVEGICAQVSVLGTTLNGIGERLQSGAERLEASVETVREVRPAINTLQRLESALVALNTKLESLGTSADLPLESVSDSQASGLRRDLGDLRVVQEAGDRRTFEALQGLQSTLDMIAARLQAQAGGQPLTSETSRVDETNASARAMLSAARSAATRALEEVGRDDSAQTREKLIEPGMGRSALREIALEHAAITDGSDRGTPADTAAGEMVANVRKSFSSPERNNETTSTKTSRVRHRAILLTLISIIVAAGAYIAVRATKPAEPVVGLSKVETSDKPVVDPDQDVTRTLASQLLSPIPSGTKAAFPGVGPGAKAVPAATLPADIPADLRDGFDANNAEMLFQAGLRYLDGNGVKRDTSIAQTWLEQAADKGSAKAAYRLGSGFEKGVFGPRDLTLARTWYRKGADGGNVTAMHNYAVLIAGADQPNYQDAAFWFRRAAEHGVRDSQYNLAVLSARGLAGSVDLRAAYVWFSIAAANGDGAAAAKRDEVARRIDGGQLAAARNDFAAFQPRLPDPVANEAVKLGS
jgi:localization factor PodJL